MTMEVYCYLLEGDYKGGLYFVAARDREVADLKAKLAIGNNENITYKGTLKELRKEVLLEGELDYTYKE